MVRPALQRNSLPEPPDGDNEGLSEPEGAMDELEAPELALASTMPDLPGQPSHPPKSFAEAAAEELEDADSSEYRGATSHPMLPSWSYPSKPHVPNPLVPDEELPKVASPLKSASAHTVDLPPIDQLDESDGQPIAQRHAPSSPEIRTTITLNGNSPSYRSLSNGTLASDANDPSGFEEQDIIALEADIEPSIQDEHVQILSREDAPRRTRAQILTRDSNTVDPARHASEPARPVLPLQPQILKRPLKPPVSSVDASPDSPQAQDSDLPGLNGGQNGGLQQSLQTAIAAPPKPKAPESPAYGYSYTDSDPLQTELEEWFSYVEIPGVVKDGRDSWERGWETSHSDEPWLEATPALRKRHIQDMLEHLEHSDPEVRFEAGRRLAYIAHGTPIYSESSDHHLLLIITNCNVLREAGTLNGVFEALKGTANRWLLLSTTNERNDASPLAPSMTRVERAECLEEINSELSMYLSILYFMGEIFNGDLQWAEEIMSVEPPLPVYLFTLVANLRERNAKGYPVKKLLLLLWKALLACIGGSQDIQRVKKLVREIEGLHNPDIKARAQLATKVATTDLAHFGNDVAIKYPSYIPPPPPMPIPGLPLERINRAVAPTPIRPTFSYQSGPDPASNAEAGSSKAQQPQPPTPAPSPPPAVAKGKKQQYQTDQSKPFVMPFSSANSRYKGKERMVPRSVEEAADLYLTNLRISTSLWQIWKVREECMAEETGLSRVLPDGSTAAMNALTDQVATLTLDEVDSDDEGSPAMDPMTFLRRLEKETRRQATQAPSPISAKLEKKAQDIVRLQRIETLYRSTLPRLQSVVIVLLKLLLATVTANNGLGNSGNAEDPPAELTLEDTDILRHREITSKAVSAVLLLTLRWFKASHALKFEYLAQLLVDSNCFLLILKMFGLQEVAQSVASRNDVEDCNFFRYCSMYGSAAPPVPRPEDILLAQPANKGTSAEAQARGEGQIITEYSSRNFFSAINFVHILQKLTKRKAHRTALLVQYKSSAILKRILKVSQPDLQLYTLKVIKSQVPYCGRKWRQSNMKVITGIYLHLRPDLREEWLTTVDLDGDIEDSLPHEQALRDLIKFFNEKHYSIYAPNLHRRSTSSLGASSNGPNESNKPPHPSPGFSHGSMRLSDHDSFPPTRPMSSISLDDHASSYLSDSLADHYLEDYEEMLGDLFTPNYAAPDGDANIWADTGRMQSEHAWQRLSAILGDYDDISDSESIGSVDYFGLTDIGADETASDEGDELKAWEQLSPETISALEEERVHSLSPAGSPRSPRPRRSSQEPRSPALRPVLSSRYDDDKVFDSRSDDENLIVPPRSPHTGPAVDEFEVVFGQ
ncbi:uncharacterized protein L969DRAFT_94615 [Mixia osmundae IAM 14324]|uniref:Far11/STRP C-terminal domain-containing protein n=1 Tax=Mixia osmundae (strain CBS 9802 / IAM 14324 / JCM 22182 / KY 12970) TaxID=764103 RepID=G7DVZ8_MIXOS|nr:uncharacterized protein L969DRAFT_94615 [Mixia osmundae IAM 14324]KEI39560.1 hypothetical protein L969DRAFT_94615 [Mixia osmundae IAM 14324]GAA94758.1 hypothetical protein E5Q_01412 [Mixia osmundae IAM 14324]